MGSLKWSPGCLCCTSCLLEDLRPGGDWIPGWSNQPVGTDSVVPASTVVSATRPAANWSVVIEVVDANQSDCAKISIGGKTIVLTTDGMGYFWKIEQGGAIVQATGTSVIRVTEHADAGGTKRLREIEITTGSGSAAVKYQFDDSSTPSAVGITIATGSRPMTFGEIFIENTVREDSSCIEITGTADRQCVDAIPTPSDPKYLIVGASIEITGLASRSIQRTYDGYIWNGFFWRGPCFTEQTVTSDLSVLNGTYAFKLMRFNGVALEDAPPGLDLACVPNASDYVWIMPSQTISLPIAVASDTPTTGSLCVNSTGANAKFPEPQSLVDYVWSPTQDPPRMNAPVVYFGALNGLPTLVGGFASALGATFTLSGFARQPQNFSALACDLADVSEKVVTAVTGSATIAKNVNDFEDWQTLTRTDSDAGSGLPVGSCYTEIPGVTITGSCGEHEWFTTKLNLDVIELW